MASNSAVNGKVQVGDVAPDFTLASQTGESVSLQDFRGKSAVVLYFYPKDDTPGCTTESCAFRDQYTVFQQAGAEVLGVSGDSADSHQRFAAKYQLPFKLLSDTNNELRKRYGVPSTLGLLPGRVTYVIDREGVVRHIFSSQFKPKAHIEEALAILKTL
ncbi:peroxiredoxin [Geitlerinema sp. PCC 7407]|uniref:peroxiredoxin n=1 Tax=Geitlerinema sp. PCC 7407 TaxID=1173025 RepID=UPI00029F93D2|nr:peroxiredoxin [Geitlerinema sp. PCC 7407]AFY65079.1 Peroxiredoxin [Geitlerinema sp. PCC 7407]